MDDRIRQILGRARYKRAIDVDHNYNLTLESKTRDIETSANKLISVLNSENVFQEERQISTLYRLTSKLEILTDNTLTKLDGSKPNDQDWDPLFDGTPPLTPNNWLLQVTYPVEIDENRFVTDTKAFRGIRVDKIESNNPSGSREQAVVRCKQPHGINPGDTVYLYDFTADSPYHGLHEVESLGVNGDDIELSFTLSTSFIGNYGNMNMKRVVDASNEDVTFYRPKTITQTQSTDLSGNSTDHIYTTFKTVTPHGLRVGNYVDIRDLGNGNPGFNGTHYVVNIIDDYNFTVKFTFTTTNGFAQTVNLLYRIMNGTPSDYYTRNFEVITTNSYDIYETAFSRNIYPKTIVNELGVSNKVWMCNFTRDIDLGIYTNHRGGPVSEIYFTIIKRAGENTFDWSTVTSHWDFNRRIADSTNAIETISSRVVGSVGDIKKKDIGDRYVGDFVEYNRKEIIETVLSKSIHRFSTADNPNGNGYYYDPFKQVPIRKYSEIIEKAVPEDNVVGIPGDYEIRPNGDKEWRDLLTPGYIENGSNGVDYPFLNGAHYIYLNHTVYVRRQIPFVELVQDGLVTVDPNIVC